MFASDSILAKCKTAPAMVLVFGRAQGLIVNQRGAASFRSKRKCGQAALDPLGSMPDRGYKPL
jgi:hypothetical protein